MSKGISYNPIVPKRCPALVLVLKAPGSRFCVFTYVHSYTHFQNNQFFGFLWDPEMCRPGIIQKDIFTDCSNHPFEGSVGSLTSWLLSYFTKGNLGNLVNIKSLARIICEIHKNKNGKNKLRCGLKSNPIITSFNINT